MGHVAAAARPCYRSVVVLVPVAIALGALDVVTWAAFRLDKSRARRRRWRIPERILLGLAVVGGVGAALGMYGHEQRHKTSKPAFLAVALVASLAQLIALGWWGWGVTEGNLLLQRANLEAVTSPRPAPGASAR